MKTWSKVQEAGPSQFRPHFDLSRANHEGSDSFLYHQKVVNKRENKSGLPPSGDVKNVTSNVLPEAPVDETTFREKHHNQRKSKFTIFKSVKKLQDHWFAPFVRSGRIRWALLLALSLCRICKSVLRHNKAVKWMPLLFLFDQCFTPLVGFDLDRFGKDELDRGGTVVGRVLPGLLE